MAQNMNKKQPWYYWQLIENIKSEIKDMKYMLCIKEQVSFMMFVL